VPPPFKLADAEYRFGCRLGPMFSVKKKGKKEVPDWKRALERGDDDEPPAKRPVEPSSVETARSEQPAVTTGASSSRQDRPEEAERREGRREEEAEEEEREREIDDDDDDEDFDPSNYDLDAGGDNDEALPPPWASSLQAERGGATPLPPPIGALPTQTAEYSGGAMKGVRYVDQDGQDTICFHSKGATNEACQSLVGTLPGYRATRFVKQLVFVLFSDSEHARHGMAALDGKPLLADDQGKMQVVRVEWAKRSLRPF
jgi:hypothetical protein